MSDTAQFRDIVDHVTPDTLRALAELPSPVVSFYVPTARHRPESERAPLELRALLEPARAQLTARGLTEDEADAVLAPVRSMQEDPVVWNEQADGLAIFASAGGMRSYRLGRPVQAAQTVGDAPLLPLVPIASGDDRYVVLALSQRRVRLFEATPSAITPMTLGDTPADIDDMERRNVRQSQLQHQHQPRSGAGGQSASHHGHGSDVSGVQLDKSVREVADGVSGRIGRGNDAPPVVLAAVAEYLPKLRDTGALPTLLDDVVAGNPDETSPADLLEASRPIAAARLDDDRARRRDRAAQLLGTGRATLDPAAALQAAQEGRVAELLLLPEADGAAGSAPAATGDAEADEAEQVAALDEAVVAALLTGAELHDLPDLPQGARLAALMRY